MRRQNIRTTPEMAASAEAKGMIVSGPMYMMCLSVIQSTHNVPASLGSAEQARHDLPT
jgi:hypothetical protein